MKGILARKGRLLLTSLAVILGTSFLAGDVHLLRHVQSTFNDLFADVFEDTDAYVRSSVVIEGDFGSKQRHRIPDSLIAEVAEVPGVRTRSQQRARVRPGHRQGRQAGRSGADGPPTFGVDRP